MTRVDITIAVCTRDNARQLGDLLASLARLRIPSGVTWELLVVDNASSDDTPIVLRDWLGRLPLRVVKEPTIGIGQARNAAVDQALGHLICWTDDDVTVPPDWLEAYWQAARRHPDAAVFGGRIVPVAREPATAWFASHLTAWPISSVVACRDLGSDERPLAPVATALPWGANFAVRRTAQKRFHYDSRLSIGEETDVVARILGAGLAGWWVPTSEVRHNIRLERQSREYIARYFQNLGDATAYLYRRGPRPADWLVDGNRWLGAPSMIVARVATLSQALSAVARAARLVTPELKFLSRANYLKGILAFRRANPIGGKAGRSSSAGNFAGKAPPADPLRLTRAE